MIDSTIFENKIEFKYIKNILREYCCSSIGKEFVDIITYSTDLVKINNQLDECFEFITLINEYTFPETSIFDLRECLNRIKIENSYLDINELYELNKILNLFVTISNFFKHQDPQNNSYKFPNLNNLINYIFFDYNICKSINKIIDENGHIKDSASLTLRKIRLEKEKQSSLISKVLQSIINNAKKNGYIPENISPSIRDGRLVLPVQPAYKRKIDGIVHDVSDSGKTVYIEPAEIVEINNKLTELENEERKEIIQLLKNISNTIRPEIQNILNICKLIGYIDFLKAKTRLTLKINAIKPSLCPYPLLDWKSAINPILKLNYLSKNLNKEVIPLDIKLYAPSQRILIISGPNAGGKSVCLKTVGLLQYMLQCGIPVPMDENSVCGVFKTFFISIGDEQSIENELSTYSSYLINMKTMLKHANGHSLILIDEFGSGTEPIVGSAMAQAILKKLNEYKIFGVITTHFQSLKTFAHETDGIINGAMLYDKQEMNPLFQLQIGIPGSSFAIEIANKIGIPHDIIETTAQIVGDDYISSEKYIQEINRDKKYWERKRNLIRTQEKKLEQIIKQYEEELLQIKKDKSIIIDNAKNEAFRILQQSNAIIEKTIKDIKISAAERQSTKAARAEIEKFKSKISGSISDKYDKKIEKEFVKIRKRLDGTNKNKNKENVNNEIVANFPDKPLTVGSYVKLNGQNTIGKILKINSKNEALVAFGPIQMNVHTDQLKSCNEPPKIKNNYTYISRETQDNIRETTLNFKSEIDLRGMRGEEALQAVKYFIDDAQVVSASKLRILHGTGNGILRNLIRQYLSSVPSVKTFHDEHPDFGGSGITVVEMN